MAGETLDFEEMLWSYNLTSEERAFVIAQNEHEKFNKDSLRDFIGKMRLDNAINNTAKKEAKDIPFDELQVSWEAVKDANEGPALDAKKALQAKSEEMLNAVDLNNCDMSTAPEITEWLKVNGSVENLDDQRKERNQNISSKINAFYEHYDSENGLAAVNPQNAAAIAGMAATLNGRLAQFDPFAVDENGNLLNSDFANIKKFYENLTIQNTDNSVENVDKKQYVIAQIELAKSEAISRLSVDPSFAAASPQEQAARLSQKLADCMEEGAVSLITAHLMAGIPEDKRGNEAEFKRSAEAAFNTIIQEDKGLVTNNGVALGSYMGRLQSQKNFEKRIAQKSENRGFWGSIKARYKNFQEQHPKAAAALGILGNVGLSMGVNMALGGVGMAGLGVYRTYQSIKKLRKECAEHNAQTGEEMSTWKYLWKNPRHMIGIVGNVASVAISGYTAGMGWDANGLVGQSINHGAGNVWNGVKESWSAFSVSDTWHNMTHSVSDEGLKNVNWGDKVKNIFNPENGLRFARNIRSLGVATATFSADVVDIFKKENKGKRWSMFGKALLKAGLTGGAVFATTPVESMDSSHVAEGADNALASSEATNPMSPLQPQDATNAPINYWEQNDNSTQMSWQQPMEGAQNEDVTVPYQPGYHPEVENTPQVSEDQLKFWNSRIDKFIPDKDTQNHIYEMIDKGEVKLPEGIETKEEYLYKLAMDVQQTPAEINSALGEGWHSSKDLTEYLKTISADQLNKINGSIDDFSDHGYHNGEIPSGRHGGNNTVIHDEQIIEQPIENKEGQETDVDPVVMPPVEENRAEPKDEEFYRGIDNGLDKEKGEHHSYADNMKHDHHSEDIDMGQGTINYANARVADGTWAEDQAKEFINYANMKLDAADGNVDGQVTDENISNHVRRSVVKDIERGVKAQADIAEEVKIASTIQSEPDTMPHPDTYTSDHTDPKFYQGMIKTVEEMQHGGKNAGEILQEAVKSGELSEGQRLVINHHYGELRQQGLTQEEILAKMKSDFTYGAEWQEAQRMARAAVENAGAEVQPTPETAPVPQQDNVVEEQDNRLSPLQPEDEKMKNVWEEKQQESAPWPISMDDQNKEDITIPLRPGVQAEGDVIKSQAGNDVDIEIPEEQTAEAPGEEQQQAEEEKKDLHSELEASRDKFVGGIEARIDAQATVNLEDAEKMSAGSYLMEKDKCGNTQILCKDENGHSIKITVAELDKLPRQEGEKSLSGFMTKVEVSPDHPLYETLQKDGHGMDGLHKALAEKEIQEKVMGNIRNGQYSNANAVRDDGQLSQTGTLIQEAKQRIAEHSDNGDNVSNTQTGVKKVINNAGYVPSKGREMGD